MTRSSSTRINRYKKGRRAEIGCLLVYMIKGYWPVKWRYKTPKGEIDLIMRRWSSIVFVEVKSRQTVNGGIHAVHRRNQRRVSAAAKYFLMQYPYYNKFDQQFDVMVVCGWRLPYHVRNAWLQ